MRPAPKSKSVRRNLARPTRVAARFEDDAEQALEEIVAAQAKLTNDVETAQDFCEKTDRKVVNKERL